MTDRWNTTNVANVTATISGAVAVSSVAGTVAVTLPVATMAGAQDTNGGTAATVRTLADHAATQGVWLCNANAAGEVYAGLAAEAITSTYHLWRLLPGQSVFIPGISNSNLIEWCCSVNSMTLNYSWI